jgi:hypothetical protein
MRQRRDREPDGYHYTPVALAAFPRYHVLGAIRVELERIDPASLENLEDTRALLVVAGMAAEDMFTRPHGEMQQRAMAEEREAFCRYVAGLIQLAERHEWKPRLRQTIRWLGAVRIDDETTHEPALHVEVGRNQSRSVGAQVNLISLL